MFQKYLYGSLNDAERAYLHEDIGNFLENLYGDQADAIAVQLAHHFLKADLPVKARRYLLTSGKQAAAKHANEEALHYFAQALDLTDETEMEIRFEILMARQDVLRKLGLSKAREEDCAAMEDLIEKREALGEKLPLEKARLALFRAKLASDTGNLALVADMCALAVEQARMAGAPALEAEAHLDWGYAAMQLGQRAEARKQFEIALNLAIKENAGKTAARAHGLFGALNNAIGNFGEGKQYFQRALSYFQAHEDLYGMGTSLNGLAISAAIQGKLDEAKTYFERALEVNRRIGARRNEATVVF